MVMMMIDVFYGHFYAHGRLNGPITSDGKNIYTKIDHTKRLQSVKDVL